LWFEGTQSVGASEKFGKSRIMPDKKSGSGKGHTAQSKAKAAEGRRTPRRWREILEHIEPHLFNASG
jgi:hypothetical protein